MNPYQKKRRWKLFLLVFAIVIGSASVFYSDFFVKKMERQEKIQFQLWVKIMEQRMRMGDDERLLKVFDDIKQNSKIDVIVTSEDGYILSWDGLDSTKTFYSTSNTPGITYDSLYFVKQLKKMKAQHVPIHLTGYNGEKLTAYYKDSFILTQLRLFPYIQLGVIFLFIITAYTAFNSARKLEQDQVWVGMAKETAHQLGTPISSLMAWVELIKSRFNAEDDPLVAEMENDIHRLEVITDRFSKIGSKPLLEDHVVAGVIRNFVNYFKIRTSDKINFRIKGDEQVQAMLNIPLFDWVIENLLKNAANAIENDGSITIKIIENLTKEQVFIDITDTGRGIPRSKFDAVFQPGYTTRKRGWGLGLSLTKRIVENYHNGQVFVKDSEAGKGTTFRIVLKSSIKYEPTTTT
ncbi:MAG: HAMP domain-containing histidine kinase [Pedobacter sp.]|nr:MAG: HAMP domain-containing histidine kinase [Pedobacter sp.]